jgi:hypothetical protein
MLYSAYFAELAEHYRKFAKRAPNGRQAGNKLALANLFLEMSWDMRLRESVPDPTVRRDQNGTRTSAKSREPFSVVGLGQHLACTTPMLANDLPSLNCRLTTLNKDRRRG